MGTKCVTASTLLIILAALAALAGFGEAASVSNFTSDFPLTFTRNEGQWNDQVAFRATAKGATMWFTSSGSYYQFVRPTEPAATEIGMPLGRIEQEPQPDEYLVIKATFEQANSAVQPVGEGLLDYRCNYFLGNDPGRWRSNVANFSAVVYPDLYPGIDLKYYGNQDRMEYDFIVTPGADITCIRIRYDGVESLSVNDAGELVIQTKWGQFTEMKPYVYQDDGDKRTAFDGAYTVISENTFGFSVGAGYDPALPVVIDPILEFSTYLGGADTDRGLSIRLNDDRDVFVCGITSSLDFPVVNGYQEEFSGYIDFYITKVSLVTGQWVFSTYLGGTGKESIPKLAIDQDGNSYIAGLTWSPDFPTVNAYDDALDGVTDAIVSKLSSGGDTLLFSTFLGGTDDEGYTCLAIGGGNDLYVSTTTWSSDFPVVDPYQISPSQGTRDITLSRFDPSGTSLVYSTYLGGVQDDEARGVVVDEQGSVYMAGMTRSPDFPVQNAYKPTLDSGTDAFVARFNPQGNGLVFSTYLGGTENDWIYDIDIDAAGDAYVVGGSLSADFQMVNAFQPVFMGGSAEFGSDAFVAKLGGTGNTLIYSSYLGGTGDDHGYGIAVDRYGCAHVTGATYSTDFPVVDPVFNIIAGDGDVFGVRIGQYGDDIEFSTFLGGIEYDEGLTIQVDDDRKAYLSGTTKSPDFPLAEPIRNIPVGYSEAFVVRLMIGCCHNLTGNVNYDENDRLNVTDAGYLVDYLFRGGAAPRCTAEADVTGGGKVETSDIIYLVDYMWKGGPEPTPCGLE